MLPARTDDCEAAWWPHTTCLGFMSTPSSLYLPRGRNPKERTDRNPEMIEIKLPQILGEIGVQKQSKINLLFLIWVRDKQIRYREKGHRLHWGVGGMWSWKASWRR